LLFEAIAVTDTLPVAKPSATGTPPTPLPEVVASATADAGSRAAAIATLAKRAANLAFVLVVIASLSFVLVVRR
jgi:hypothetical protein